MLKYILGNDKCNNEICYILNKLGMYGEHGELNITRQWYYCYGDKKLISTPNLLNNIPLAQNKQYVIY